MKLSLAKLSKFSLLLSKEFTEGMPSAVAACQGSPPSRQNTQ